MSAATSLRVRSGCCGRVRERDDAAVRVAEHVELLLAEVHAQLLDVGDVVGGRVRARVLGRSEPRGAARVEQDERERLAEPAEVGEVARREAGPAGMADEHRPRRPRGGRSTYARPACGTTRSRLFSLDDAISAREIRRDPNPVAERFEQLAGLLGALRVRPRARAARPDAATSSARARERLGLTLVDERLARLPVAHLGLERVDLVGADVRRVRDDEVERARRSPSQTSCVHELDVEPGARRVLARERERVGATRRWRRRARRRPRPRARARSRRCPSRRRARAVRLGHTLA